MLIGLTGGIASGKNTVAAVLRTLGAEIVDADQISHELAQPGSCYVTAIAEVFGPGILASNGSLDRESLKAIVLESPLKLKVLNFITHPLILEEIKARLSRSSARVKVLVAPLLIESGAGEWVDEIWVTETGQDMQLQRLCRRDNLAPAQALKIMAAQMPQEEKRRYARVIIDNNGSREQTKALTVQAWEELQARLDQPGLWDDGYCFACGPFNSIGLKLKFTFTGGVLTTAFTPAKRHQGFPGIVHGGVVSTLLDEAMAWLTIKMGYLALTAKIEVKFKAPAPINTALIAEASCTGHSGKILHTQARLKDGTGKVYAEAAAMYIIKSRDNPITGFRDR